MKRLVGVVLVALGLVSLGIAIGFNKEAKSNEGVSAVQCGYVYEEHEPEYLPVRYIDEFEEHIWDMYISEYCVNYCGTCDSYSYEHCLCCECTDDSECSELDYQLFIEDNMEAIADEYYEWLSWIQEDYREMNSVVYEF